MVRCVYCHKTGKRWAVETNGFFAPAVLCPEHAQPLRQIAERMEEASRDAAASGDTGWEPPTGGIDVLDDPDSLIRRLEDDD